MNIGERLKKIRTKLGLSQSDATARYGLTLSSYKKYEAGIVEPGANALTSIANSGINPYWLLTGKGDMLLGAKSSGGNVMQTSVSYEESEADFVLVSRYNVEASAGHGAIVGEEEQIGHLAFRKDWLKSKGLQKYKLNLIKTKGDSMEPTLHDGDLLLVDTSIEKIIDDTIYIIQTDHHLVVKRLQQSLDGSVLVISDNPRYEKQHIDAETAKNLKIAGRLCWYGHEM